MSILSDEIYDQGLDWAETNGQKMHIHKTALPTTYAEAVGANELGTGTVTTGPTTDGATDGRRVTTSAITTGAITADGMAAHWAITDGVGLFVASGALSTPQAVTAGNTFTLDAVSLTIRDAA